jgi:hypothetical protein
MIVMVVWVFVWQNDFLWQDINNYSGQREIFIGMSGPQNSVQDIKDIVGTFEL